MSPGLGPGEPRGERRRAGPGGAAARRTTPAAHQRRTAGSSRPRSCWCWPRRRWRSSRHQESVNNRATLRRAALIAVPLLLVGVGAGVYLGTTGDDGSRAAGRRRARERRDLAGGEPGPRRRLVRRRAAPPRPHGARRRGAQGHDQDRDRSRLRRRPGPRGLRRGRRQPGGARPQGPRGPGGGHRRDRLGRLGRDRGRPDEAGGQGGHHRQRRGVGGGGRRCAGGGRGRRHRLLRRRRGRARAAPGRQPRGPDGHPARPPRRPLPHPRLPARRGHDRGRPVLLRRRVPGPGTGRRALPGRQPRGHPAAGHGPGRALRHPLRRGAPERRTRRRPRGHVRAGLPAHRDLRRRARRPVTRTRARAPHLRAHHHCRSASSPPGSPTRAVRRCWHAEGMGDPHQFRQVDVFGSGPLTGNPVAVVHDADDLDDARMQLFAQWTNLSETTFLLSPTSAEADYRLRIFTASRELPFAGHPTLGSAHAWLEAGGTPRGEAVVQECGAGLVTIARGDRLAFEAPPLLRDGPVERRGPRPRHPGAADHARRHRRQQVVRQRAGLGRRTPEGRPGGPRPAARPHRVRRAGTSASSAPGPTAAPTPTSRSARSTPPSRTRSPAASTPASASGSPAPASPSSTSRRRAPRSAAPAGCT